MFNCEKCWDRICTCGHEYRNLPHTVKIGITIEGTNDCVVSMFTTFKSSDGERRPVYPFSV